MTLVRSSPEDSDVDPAYSDRYGRSHHENILLLDHGRGADRGGGDPLHTVARTHRGTRTPPGTRSGGAPSHGSQGTRAVRARGCDAAFGGYAARRQSRRSGLGTNSARTRCRCGYRQTRYAVAQSACSAHASHRLREAGSARASRSPERCTRGPSNARGSGRTRCSDGYPQRAAASARRTDAPGFGCPPDACDSDGSQCSTIGSSGADNTDCPRAPGSAVGSVARSHCDPSSGGSGCAYAFRVGSCCLGRACYASRTRGSSSRARCSEPEFHAYDDYRAGIRETAARAGCDAYCSGCARVTRTTHAAKSGAQPTRQHRFDSSTADPARESVTRTFAAPSDSDNPSDSEPLAGRERVGVPGR